MSFTEKLYLTDAYQTSFDATVLRCDAVTDVGFSVVLDRSAFYPASGGQLPDAGVLGDVTVLDVQEGNDDTVIHTVAVAIGAGRVSGSIDWDRRFDHMQQHTGQHVLSRAFIEAGDLQTVSFHMGEDTCTIDLAGAAFDPSAAQKAEALANRVIEENRPVTTRTVHISDLKVEALRRKLPEGVTEVRLVDVTDFDLIPCCGTHVSRTGELRAIKVLNSEKVKGNVRVYFRVGRRALADYTHKHDVLQALGAQLTTSIDEVSARVDKLIADGQAARKSASQLARKLAVLERDLLLASADEMEGGVRFVVRMLPDADGGYLRTLSSELRGGTRVVAILGAGDGSVVCVASDGVSIDFSGAADLARAMGGSGGGRGGFVQVKLPVGADVSAFTRNISEDVRHAL